jgi:hypothetical protein
MKLDMFGDIETTLPAIELHMLRRIAETSHDMIAARTWPEFREATGGQDILDKAHERSVREYEEWLSDGA